MLHVRLLPVENLDISLSLFFHLREDLVGSSDFLLQLNPVCRQTLQALWTSYGGHNTHILQQARRLLVLGLELQT